MEANHHEVPEKENSLRVVLEVANPPERGAYLAPPQRGTPSSSRYESESTAKYDLFGGTTTARNAEEAEAAPSDSSSVSSESLHEPRKTKSGSKKYASPHGRKKSRKSSKKS